MDDERLEDAALRLLDANRFVVLSTADADGRPWATPVWYAHDRGRELIWVSRPGARHSLNIAVRPEVAAVVYDSTAAESDAEALYLEASAGESGPDELDRLLAVYTARTRARGLPDFTVDRVTGDAQFRLYRARVTASYLLDEHDARIALPARA